jgi:hypothetical protein
MATFEANDPLVLVKPDRMIMGIVGATPSCQGSTPAPRKSPMGTSINSNLVENSYGRAALSAFVCLQ